MPGKAVSRHKARSSPRPGLASEKQRFSTG
jgi:hypothetical protein